MEGESAVRLWRLVPFLAVVVVLVLAEVLLRLVGLTVWHNPLDGRHDSHALVQFDRVLGFRNRSDVWFTSDKRPEHRQTDYLNAFGMRQPALSHAKPTGVRRIAMLGDSITFGVGMASYRDLYPYRLEQMCLAGGAQVQVLNFGVVGNTSFQVRRGLEYTLSFEPEILIVMIGNNDSRRSLGVAEAQTPEVIAFDERVGRWLPGSQGWVVVNLLRRGLVQLKSWRLKRERPPATRVSLDEFRDNLAAVIRACRAAGVRVYLVDEKLAANPVGPGEKTWGDRSKMENYPRYRQVLQELARTEGVGFIDVTTVLEAEKQPRPAGYRADANRVLPEYLHLFVEQDPIHLNATGHALVARTLYQRLAADGM
jgi:lysophospholipase L1-like esterase